MKTNASHPHQRLVQLRFEAELLVAAHHWVSFPSQNAATNISLGRFPSIQTALTCYWEELEKFAPFNSHRQDTL